MALYRGYPMSIISAVFGSFVLMSYDGLKVKMSYMKGWVLKSMDGYRLIEVDSIFNSIRGY